jgi:hypothetical protein
MGIILLYISILHAIVSCLRILNNCRTRDPFVARGVVHFIYVDQSFLNFFQQNYRKLFAFENIPTLSSIYLRPIGHYTHSIYVFLLSFPTKVWRLLIEEWIYLSKPYKAFVHRNMNQALSLFKIRMWIHSNKNKEFYI